MIKIGLGLAVRLLLLRSGSKVGPKDHDPLVNSGKTIAFLTKFYLRCPPLKYVLNSRLILLQDQDQDSLYDNNVSQH